jgi:hypothetical protein
MIMITLFHFREEKVDGDDEEEEEEEEVSVLSSKEIMDELRNGGRRR